MNKKIGVWLGTMLAVSGCFTRPAVAEPADAPDESVFLANWSGGSSELAVSSPEAVAWTLRYPTLFSSRKLSDGAWEDAIKAYEQGRLLEAMIAFDKVPPAERNASYLTYHAHFLLLTGNEKEAGAELDRALKLDPNSAEAWSLRAIMDLRQGRAKDALQHADRAVALEPDLPAAHLARSYALQAGGALAAATASAERVLALEPDSALAQVRLAELDLASGRQQTALAHALKAVGLGRNLPDAWDALGFVRLGLNQADEALVSFKEAERLNELDPAAHFGMGLAYIRSGRLVQGREQLENAVTLAPSSALPHTYLGRAYDLEGRGKEAAAEYAQAAKLDPRDPVPFRFDAIRLAADNSPVDAQRKLQSALHRLGNRAVYRSQDLLAQDRALYLADLSDVDGVLGLDDRSWLDAARAVSEDFDSGAAHLAAGDALAALPRTGVAKQSEYLQALLREPLGVLPPPLSVTEGIEPGQVAPQQGFFRAASPDRTGYNEFGAVFNAADSNVDLDVTGGSQGSLGDQLRVAKATGNVGLTFSQLHFETNGFGTYDNLYDAAWRGTLQYDLSPATRLHLEYQDTDLKRTGVKFPNDPVFAQPQTIGERRERSRLALRHDFSESSQLILLASREDLKQAIENLPTVPSGFLARESYDGQAVRSDVLEAQYLYQLNDWRFIAGVSQVREDQNYAYGVAYNCYLGFCWDSSPSSSVNAYRTTTLYGYGQYSVRPDLIVEGGLASDRQSINNVPRHLVSPKLGVSWQAVPGGTLRLAATQSLNRFFINGATLEPAEVAGFQQYFNDALGMRSIRVGIGWDQRFGQNWDWGFELSRRQLRQPAGNFYDHWLERNGRIWLSRTLSSDQLAGVLPGWQGSVVLAYDGQDYVRHEQLTGNEQIRDYRPRQLRLAGHLFDAAGWGVDMGVTWVRTRGTLNTLDLASLSWVDTPIDGAFPVADVAVTLKLPRHRGQVSVGVLNLFDRRFQYLEMDPANPRFAPERYLYARLRLTL